MCKVTLYSDDDHEDDGDDSAQQAQQMAHYKTIKQL